MIRCDHPDWTDDGEPDDSEMRQIHETFAEECADFRKPTAKQRAARSEQEIIDEITKNGGFSCFWVTDNQDRAKALDRLQASGRVVRSQGDKFPRCTYTIPTPPTT